MQSCSLTCVSAACNDGFVWAGQEECDDQNNNPNDGCVSCVINVCGDEFVWTGVETCDDGNVDPGDGCEPDCEPSIITQNRRRSRSDMRGV